MGKVTGATPDGRLAGTPLSLNTAPAHGVAMEGLGGVLRSVCKVNHTALDNAGVLDVNLSADTPPEVIGHIADYLLDKDVLLAQFNAINREDMENAMITPEQYQDLTVRVTGFSARFVVLPEKTQKEIIARSSWGK